MFLFGCFCFACLGRLLLTHRHVDESCPVRPAQGLATLFAKVF